MISIDRLAAPLGALLLVMAVPLAAEGGTGAPRSVSASDLENGMQIIGLLGLPLGELASIRARIISSNSKEADQYMEVLAINGVGLSKPMQLVFAVWPWGNLANKTLPLNQEMSLRAYETGAMQGVPERAMKETSQVASVQWGFRTSLVVLYELK